MKQILKTTLFLATIAFIALAVQSCKTVKPIDKAQLEGIVACTALLVILRFQS